MSRRTLRTRQEHAVYELLTVAPFVPPDRRFTYPELLIYQEGYHTAIVRALQVMQLATRRQQLAAAAPAPRARRRGAA